MMAAAPTNTVVVNDLEQDFFKFVKLRRYKLLHKSSTGEVWLAKSEAGPERSFVVKTFCLDVAKTRDENERRFSSEVKVLKTVNHDHVMKCIYAARCPGYAAYAMAYYSRGCLLDTSTDLEPRMALRYTRMVAQALAHLHRRHVAHNDVKLDNVMLTNADRAVLGDFGHCLEVSISGVASAHRVGGTKCYWPPERWEADAQRLIDPYKADIYALGVLYWSLLSGEDPDDGINYTDRVNNLDLTKETRSILHQLLHPDPSRRPTASQVVKLLERN